MASGRGTTSGDREGVRRGNFQKNDGKVEFWAKISFFNVRKCFSKHFAEHVEKLQFFGVRDG